MGGITWSTLFTLLGYFFGGIPAVQEHFELVIVGIILVSVIPAAVGAIKAKFGKKEQAAEFLGRFNWAPEFMRLNGEMLEEYSKAKDSSEVVRIQNEYIEAVRKG